MGTLAKLVEDEAWADVLASLTALDTLEARCRESLPALLTDLALVLRRASRPLPPDFVWAHSSGAQLDHVALALVETTLDAHREALLGNPGRLFAVLYNALYWRDAPEGDAHYASPSPRDGREIWRWMEFWRREVEARPHARWLRRLRPPRPTPTALLGWRTAGSLPTLGPDGALLLVTHADSLELFDARTERSLGRLPRPSEYLGRGNRPHGGFSPGGDRVLTFRDKSATVWSVAPLAELKTFGPVDSTISRAAFSRDGRVVFTGSAYSAVHAWDAEDGSHLATLETPDGLLGLYACGGDRVVVVTYRAWRLWSPRDGVVSARPSDETEPLQSVALSPPGDRLITRSQVALEGFGLPDGERLFRRASSGHEQVEDVHPRGDLVALNVFGICELRDSQTGVRTRLPLTHVQRAMFDPTGRFLLLCQGWQSTLWDLDANAGVAWAWQSVNTEGLASFSRDGSRLAIGNAETLVLDMATLAPAPTMRDDTPPPIAHAQPSLSPSGSTLSAQTEAGLAFWDMASGRRLRLVSTNHHILRHGHHLLSYRDGELIELDLETGVDRFVLRVPGDPLEYPAVNQGDMLLARTRSGLVVGFSLDDGGERYRLPTSPLLALLAPDLFAIRNPDGTLSVRAVSTGHELLALPQRAGRELTLSPDRRWLAVAGFDSNTVEVWELAPGGRRHVVDAGYDSFSVTFSADGASVMVSSWGPTPQSGNSDADSYEAQVALEPGERFLPAPDVPPAPVQPQPLKKVAPELQWDRGRSLADALVFERPSGTFVVDVTADQVEVFRLEPRSR